MKKLSDFWNRNDTYFRAGAGMFIYTSDNQFLVFERRLNPESFQFPQGGRDKGETFEETLWREIGEEIALSVDDFSSVSMFPHLLSYEYPKETNPFHWLGQTHQWFYLKLKDGIEIDLTKAKEPEFTSYRLVSEQEVLENIYDPKLPVYTQLFEHFNKVIK